MRIITLICWFIMLVIMTILTVMFRQEIKDDIDTKIFYIVFDAFTIIICIMGIISLLFIKVEPIPIH